MDWFYWSDIPFMVAASILSIFLIGTTAWAVVKIVRTICKTIVLNTKIKYFGTSQEYEDFKAWKKMQTEDMTEL